MPDGRQSLVSLVEGHYLSELARFLHASGVLEKMDTPRTPETVAAEHGLDPALLRLALTYVADRSDLLDSTPAGFVCAEKYRDGRRGWVLDQYLGAYGPLVSGVGQVLREPRRGPALVNGALHAQAYAALERPAYRALPAVIGTMAPNHLVDLGCGSGALLRQLAGEHPKLRGWGLDANPEMCRVARERLCADGFAERITILEGEVWDLGAICPAEAAESVEVVVCASLLNHGCANGAAGKWLGEIKRAFPERTLVVADYYGRLGSGVPAKGGFVLLHDLVQALSGQGVPPPDREGWERIYTEAGCRLQHAFEGEDATPWFIHLVRL